MNITGKIGGFLFTVAKETTHVNGKYDPNRAFKTAALIAFSMAAAAMTAMFLLHGIKHTETAAEYLAYASGLGAVGALIGAGAWMHSNAKDTDGQ